MLALFGIRRGHAALARDDAAYEHHMRTDLSGYPRRVRQRTVAVLQDHRRHRRLRCGDHEPVYQEAPWTPADVLRGMRDNPRLGLDPVVVKAFINLSSIYPVGTVVVLDTRDCARWPAIRMRRRSRGR